MTEQTTRKYTSDLDAYAVFVGQITPQEFIKGYEDFEDVVDEAVKDFLRQFPFDEQIPEWLEDALYRYVSSSLEKAEEEEEEERAWARQEVEQWDRDYEWDED